MKTNQDLRTLTRLALLVAIELVMKAVGLGSVPMGPLYMSFLTLPIAVGAITMGPMAGAVLGGVFGAVSFYDAVTGASAMTGALFQVSPLHTFILCVGMRMLMGLLVGLIFQGLKKADHKGTWSYFVSSMAAPGLNTLLFMGYIVLAFYNCDYVQSLVANKGASNPFMFVVLLVGVQGVAEFLVSGILGGVCCKKLPPEPPGGVFACVGSGSNPLRHGFAVPPLPRGRGFGKGVKFCAYKLDSSAVDR